ncbi:hypothetical protein L6452_37951 [Arctium lappa]|uniref:Uncharacterized protein n=1 Tax=Arctium lappa TaxID=4217 RepID=A0ACB8Y4Y7_ARCLA|nr:hypothetical protein L6452_37951 [Arctium lappa]
MDLINRLRHSSTLSRLPIQELRLSILDALDTAVDSGGGEGGVGGRIVGGFGNSGCIIAIGREMIGDSSILCYIS